MEDRNRIKRSRVRKLEISQARNNDKNESRSNKMVRLKDVKIDIPLFLDKNRDEFYQCWSLPMAYAMQKEFEEAMFNPELPTLPRSL